MPANRREFFRWLDFASIMTARQMYNNSVPYRANDADTDEPLSAQESHGNSLSLSLFDDDEGHLLWNDP